LSSITPKSAQNNICIISLAAPVGIYYGLKNKQQALDITRGPVKRGAILCPLPVTVKLITTGKAPFKGIFYRRGAEFSGVSRAYGATNIKEFFSATLRLGGKSF